MVPDGGGIEVKVEQDVRKKFTKSRITKVNTRGADLARIRLLGPRGTSMPAIQLLVFSTTAIQHMITTYDRSLQIFQRILAVEDVLYCN
jgi:hypothetical protein